MNPQKAAQLIEQLFASSSKIEVGSLLLNASYIQNNENEPSPNGASYDSLTSKAEHTAALELNFYPHN